MSKISLVVATIGREKEVERLLNSIDRQTRSVDEVIVVDQNEDDRIKRILTKYPQLPIVHIAFKPMGANAARNLGLRSATGDIVGFPDDDCWFPSEVLKKVEDAFVYKSIDILSGKVLTEADGVSVGRWQASGGPISCNNVWTTTIEFAVFFSRDILNRVGGFDENLGPGAPSIYGAHEIDDLVIRTLQHTSRTLYDPTLLVGHDEPISTYDAHTFNRAFRYGAGLGYVLRKHQYPFLLLLQFLARSIGGAVISLIRRDLGRAQFYLSVCVGRIFGWVFAKKQPLKNSPLV